MIAIASSIVFVVAATILIYTNYKNNVINRQSIPLSGTMNDKMKDYYFCLYRASSFDEFDKVFAEASDRINRENDSSYFIFNINILLHCNLDSGRWLVFCSQIQKDKNRFWDELVKFKKTAEFAALSDDDKNKINDYIGKYIGDSSYYNVNYSPR